MHQISDGERRRVQLCMGLMGEWDVLLLDEVCRILLSYAVVLVVLDELTTIKGDCRFGCIGQV